MPKFFASDPRVKQVDIEGARTGSKRILRPGKDGLYEATSKADIKALSESGFVQASLMGATITGAGFPCAACGFGSWFAVCSKCGTDNGPQNANA